MLSRIFRRAPAQAERLYAGIVVAARQPALYAALNVPDSLDGRYEAIVLHAWLVLRRLRARPDDAARQAERRLAQELYDVMFGDFDRGLDAADPAVLADALRRNLYGTVADPRAADVTAMAAYVRAADAALAARTLAALESGDLDLPPLPDAAAGAPRADGAGHAA